MPDPLVHLADRDLWVLCCDGRAAAWATLVQRYQRLVYTIPRRAGLDEACSADVFQTTFARFHAHLHTLQQPERLRAWLVTTAKRESLRQLQRQRRQPLAEPAPGVDGPGPDPGLQVPDPGPLPDELLAALQEQQALLNAVARLDARTRLFVELYFLQDPPLSQAELAARLGLAVGSIGPTRARCLAKLRSLLEAEQ